MALSKENPFPNSKLLPTNAQGSGFLLRHNNTDSRGRGGGGKNHYSYDDQKNALEVFSFIKSFVQDCRLNNFNLNLILTCNMGLLGF